MLALERRASVTGVQIGYYFICHTKLWLFSHHATMEQTSDAVALGRLLHQGSYRRQRKELKIGGISIDFVRKGDSLELHEVKKSRRMEEAHEYQLLYYLHYLKGLGITATGVIDYPLIRQKKEVSLDSEREARLREVLAEIPGIVALPRPPPPVKKSYCRKCSYFEFCWVS